MLSGLGLVCLQGECKPQSLRRLSNFEARTGAFYRHSDTIQENCGFALKRFGECLKSLRGMLSLRPRSLLSSGRALLRGVPGPRRSLKDLFTKEYVYIYFFFRVELFNSDCRSLFDAF